MTLRDEHLEPVVGAFLGLGLLLMGAAVVFSLAGGFRSEVRYGLELEDGVGLAQGNPVTIAGVEVGVVDAVELSPQGTVRIGLRVEERYAGFVRADSVGTATYTTTGKVVRIEGGTEEAGPLPVGGTLRPGTNFDPVSALERMDLVGNLRQIQEILTQINDLARQLDLGEGQLPETVAALESLVLDLQAGRGTLGALLKDDATLTDLRRTMREVDQMSAALQEVSAQLGQTSGEVTAASRSIVAASGRVEGSAGQFDSTSATVADSSEKLGRSLGQLDATLEELGRTMRAIQALPLVRGKVEDAPAP